MRQAFHPIKLRDHAFRAGAFSTAAILLTACGALFFYHGAVWYGVAAWFFAAWGGFQFLTNYPFIDMVDVKQQDGESIDDALDRALKRRGPGYTKVTKPDDSDEEGQEDDT